MFMIICSCKIVCTRKIQECIDRMHNPTVQKILKELNWKPECATCAKNIVKEINLILDKSSD